jgi:hypothetical protein
MHRETEEMKLTAYALGELNGAEREAIEGRLASSAADRQHVEEVRAAARQIREELTGDQTDGLDAIHYAAIELRLRDAGGQRPADRSAAVRGRVGLVLTLAVSIVIVVATIGILLYSLLRHASVAANESSSTHGTVLLPLESLPAQPAPAAVGFGTAPNDADPFVSVAAHPESSFGMSPDTASYDELRQALAESHLPLHDSIKIEGLINAFAYKDPAPAPGALFGAGIEVARCPWTPEHRLARIQVKARGGEGIIAEDVRAEVHFDPAAAKSYRLIGYEGSGTSAPLHTGERVAAGQGVTALYEIIPASHAASATELLKLSIRFRPSADAPEQTIQFIGRDADKDPKAASADFRFAAAVAEFGMALRDSPGRGRSSMNEVIRLASSGRGADPAGERQRFIELAERAKSLLG